MAVDIGRKIILYGAGYPDTVKLIARITDDLSASHIHGFIDDQKTDAHFMRFPILGNWSILDQINVRDFRFVNNVFKTMQSRATVSEVLTEYQCDIMSLIDPEVDLLFTEIGQGAVIMKGAQLGANLKMGRFCTVRMNAVVNHDNTLGDFVFIGPGVTLCGHVTIDDHAYIGAGSVVKEHVHIGANAIIGAGSVVTQNVAANTTVKGVPAKP